MVHSKVNGKKRLPAKFFQQEGGNEPVRDWLLKLTVKERLLIGNDIMTAEFGWPIGMPLCRPMGGGGVGSADQSAGRKDSARPVLRTQQ